MPSAVTPFPRQPARHTPGHVPGHAPAAALQTHAMVALINARLAHAAAPIPGQAAVDLICELVEAGLAQVSYNAETHGQITLCAITATCTGGTYGLLRNWQSAANLHLRQKTQAARHD